MHVYRQRVFLKEDGNAVCCSESIPDHRNRLVLLPRLTILPGHHSRVLPQLNRIIHT